MRVVLQRASRAQVRVGGEVVGALPRPGLLALVGITGSDTPTEARRLAEKVWRLRILDGERSASDLGAPVLAVSQFTLYADTRKGRRPSWNKAAPGPVSEPLFEEFVTALTELGCEVSTGVFGAAMEVELVNDGPCTLLLEQDAPTAQNPATE